MAAAGIKEDSGDVGPSVSVFWRRWGRPGGAGCMWVRTGDNGGPKGGYGEIQGGPGQYRCLATVSAGGDVG